MKTLKILFAAFIIAGFATSAVADTPSATAEASATILQFIEVNKLTDIDFGGISADVGAPLLDPVNTANNANVGLSDFDPAIGKFTISGAGNAEIMIFVDTDPVTLSNGTHNLNYLPSFSYLAGTGATFGGELITDGEEQLDEEGDGQVFVGGTITDLDGTKSAGTYTNDNAVTISVEYM